jgi:sugar-specific transcriptional regulator TrmB
VSLRLKNLLCDELTGGGKRIMAVDTNDNEFTKRLLGFGLSEKEAQIYLHLLKNGSKSTSLLAKSFKTYREDVHRTLASLIHKGIVTSSQETPTVYTAVDLDIALDSALEKYKNELREMEQRKHELQELSKKQNFRPSDEFCTFKIIKSVNEFLALTIPLLSTLREEWLFIVPQEMVAFASLYGMSEASKEFIRRGGMARCIIDVSHSMIELTRELLDIGYDVRHYDEYHGIYFVVGDRKQCMSALNVDIGTESLDEPVTVLWIDSSTYAAYLASTFELLWELGVPAAQRIEELLKEGSAR